MKGIEFKEIREQAGLTQDDVLQVMDISKTWFSKLENSREDVPWHMEVIGILIRDHIRTYYKIATEISR